MSRPAPIHICFYSNHCKWSEAFLTRIKETPFKYDFNYICVDPGKRPANLPGWLKQTPTLVIRGEPEPRVDGEVMNWISEQEIKQRPSVPIGGGNVQSNKSDELMPYMDGGYGDSFSFLDSPDGAQSMQQHSFTFLNGQDSVGTRDASSVQSVEKTDKISKKQQMLDKQFEMYKRDRDAVGKPVTRT